MFLNAVCDKMEKKTRTIKRRRNYTPTSVFFFHHPNSDMHKAITNRDEDKIKELLDKGGSLCCGVDLSLRHRTITPNCFTLAHSLDEWEFVKFLLSIDPNAGSRAINIDGLTLLMLYAKELEENAIEYLLEIGSDVNYCCNDGRTALMWAITKFYPPPELDKSEPRYVNHLTRIQKVLDHRAKFQRIVNFLIKKGSDVDICDVNGENALHIAVKNPYTFDLEIVQTLINAGVNPTAETLEHCTVLSYAMKTFGEMCVTLERNDIVKEVYPAIRYLFNLAPFERDTFQLHCDAAMHPQTFLLQRLNCCQMTMGNRSIIIDLTGTTNFLNPDLVVLESLRGVKFDTVVCTKLPFAPLALYLNFDRYCNPSTSMVTYHIVMENLEYFMSVGFRATVQAQETISPLTVGLLHEFILFNYIEFAKVILKSGVHVEQRMLRFAILDLELERLSADLSIPDVLRVALSRSHLHPAVTLELIKMFMPHYAHPGLTLLPFATPEKVFTLFPFLASCGSLQHTALHITVQRRILKSGWLSAEHLLTFNQMIGCVPRLQSLCRTVVRAQLAPRASENGNTLQEVISSVPPIVIGKFAVDVAEFLE